MNEDEKVEGPIESPYGTKDCKICDAVKKASAILKEEGKATSFTIIAANDNDKVQSFSQLGKEQTDLANMYKVFIDQMQKLIGEDQFFDFLHKIEASRVIAFYEEGQNEDPDKGVIWKESTEFPE